MWWFGNRAGRQADEYQNEYGFMALSAVLRHRAMFHLVHCFWLDDELQAIASELERRGVTVIKSEEEYKAGIARYGVPPAFQKKAEVN